MTPANWADHASAIQLAGVSIEYTIDERTTGSTVAVVTVEGAQAPRLRLVLFEVASWERGELHAGGPVLSARLALWKRAISRLR